MSGDVLQELNPDRWRALAVLAVTLVLSMTLWFSAVAVIPQLRAEWALSVNAAAWLTIAVQLGFVCGALASSLLNISDVVPPKHVILGGAVGAATANGLLEVASGAGVGIALRFATGFFLAGVYPPALKLMCTWFRKGRGIALGILVGAIVVGQAMPHLINELGRLNWRVVIYVTCVLTLAGGLITVFAVMEGPFPFPGRGSIPRRCGACSRIGASGSLRSVTSATCGNCLQCMRG